MLLEAWREELEEAGISAWLYKVAGTAHGVEMDLWGGVFVTIYRIGRILQI